MEPRPLTVEASPIDACFSGPCESSNILRDPIYENRDCYTPIRNRTKIVNAQVTQLAPVLNTQSWDYGFKPKLDTMFKELDGSYCIFAMPSGIRGGSATGAQTLRLPLGLNASHAEVLFEDRRVDIANGEITDTFAADHTDHTYHIYKISPVALTHTREGLGSCRAPLWLVGWALSPGDALRVLPGSLT